MTNFPRVWYRHTDARVTCPYKLKLIDLCVTLIFCGGAQANQLAQAQRVGPMDEAANPAWHLIPVNDLLQAYCDVGAGLEWRKQNAVHLLPLTIMRILARTILAEEAMAPRVLSAEVGRVLLDNPSLCHPAPTCFHPRMNARHDWFAVWAGRVKQYRILTPEEGEFYRYLSEYELTQLVLTGGQAEAKRIAERIFEAIKLLGRPATEASVEAEIG